MKLRQDYERINDLLTALGQAYANVAQEYEPDEPEANSLHTIRLALNDLRGSVLTQLDKFDRG